MFLSREEMFDRSLGGISQENEVPHWAGNIAYVVVALVLKLFFRYRVENREVLRAFKGKQGVIVASNHTSYLDVAFMWCAIRPAQWIRLMARDSLFETAGGFGGQIIARAGAFPVKRDSADRTSIKRAARMLKNGEMVGIFPEGTRRGKGSQEPAIHGGVALIAKMGNAPIIPATVRNAEKIKRKGERIRFPQVSVAFGKPLYLENFNFVAKEDRLEACSWYVMRECYALFYNIPASEVDMPQLFPHSKDYTQLFAEHPLDTLISTPDASSAKEE